MHFKKIFAIFLSMLMLLMLISPLGTTAAYANAARRITVYSVDGTTAELHRNNRTTRPRTNTRISAGDTLKTGTSTEVLFNLDGTSLVKMGEFSTLSFELANNLIALNLETGNSLVQVAEQPANSTIEARLGNLHFVVRGTMFTMEHILEDDLVSIVMLSGIGEIDGYSLTSGQILTAWHNVDAPTISGQIVHDWRKLNQNIVISEIYLNELNFFTIEEILNHQEYLLKNSDFITMDFLQEVAIIAETLRPEKQTRPLNTTPESNSDSPNNTDNFYNYDSSDSPDNSSNFEITRPLPPQITPPPPRPTPPPPPPEPPEEPNETPEESPAHIFIDARNLKPNFSNISEITVYPPPYWDWEYLISENVNLIFRPPLARLLAAFANIEILLPTDWSYNKAENADASITITIIPPIIDETDETDEPENPEIPETGNPDETDEPENPEIPETGNPDETDEPEEPETPETGNPDETDEPEEPEIPETGNPDETDEPEEPETPETGNPGETDETDEPETPETGNPDETDETDEPEEPETPETGNPDETDEPEEPEIPETGNPDETDEPEEPEDPNNPAENANIFTISSTADWTTFINMSQAQRNQLERVELISDIAINNAPLQEIFNGLFEGNGNTISTIITNSFTPTMAGVGGLFASIGPAATVQNVHINANINLDSLPSPAGFTRIGGLAGQSFGTIENVAVTGIIRSNVSAGGVVGRIAGGTANRIFVNAMLNGDDNTAIGGIAGIIEGAVVTVSNSYSMGFVGQADTHNAGGIAGQNFGGTILRAFSTATIEGITAGGITGTNTGSVENSVALNHNIIGANIARVSGTAGGNLANNHASAAVPLNGLPVDVDNPEVGATSRHGTTMDSQPSVFWLNTWQTLGFTAANGWITDYIPTLANMPAYVEQNPQPPNPVAFGHFDFTENHNEFEPIEPEPIEPEPTEPEPTEPEPDKPEPDEPDPIEPDPTEPDPTEPEPIEPEPTEPEPTEPEPIKPDPIEPDPTEPDPTEPDPIEPEPTEPEPIKPEPIEPDPIEPDPTEPDPTEPEPIEPDPTEPDPTEPEPIEPEPIEPETDEPEPERKEPEPEIEITTEEPPIKPDPDEVLEDTYNDWNNDYSDALAVAE